MLLAEKPNPGGIVDTHTTSTEHFDVLVLGSGEGGKYLSWTLGADGRRVAMVERRYVGGSCPNIACLPSKNVVHSAKVAWYGTHAAEYGLQQPAGGVDMRTVRQRKRDMVDGLVEMHKGRFARSKVEFLFGMGRFVGPKTVEVTLIDGSVRRVTAEVVIVSTGSRATVPDVPGLHEAAPLTHVEALELDVVPEHLVILGGGYVGLEFAQAMRRFGAQVTVVDRGKRFLPREDEDVAAELRRLLEAEGIRFVLNATVREVQGRSGERVRLAVIADGVEETITGTHILAAAGRTPNTDGIGLVEAGVALDASGHIQVDGSLRTTAEGVFAVGDCAGSPHFTHIAYDDYRVVYETLQGGTRVTTGRQVPYTLFTDPELAHVGLHEYEAKQQGVSYRVARLPMVAVLRTRTLGESEGFLKALVGQDDRIVGFTALGVSAGELLAPVQLAMSAGLPYTALRDLVVTHPTLTEGLMYLFSAVPAKG